MLHLRKNLPLKQEQPALMTPIDTSAYLFVWNPIKWPWPEIGEDSRSLQSGAKVTEAWNCVSHKKVRPGDRAFVSKVGSEPKGVFASGVIASEPFLAKSRKNKDIHHVLIDFDVILDPAKSPILTLELLNMGRLAKQLWTPQSSGISMKPELAEELEALWQDFLHHEIKWKRR
jgi:5-methylcytosine-specific restriction protein A